MGNCHPNSSDRNIVKDIDKIIASTSVENVCKRKDRKEEEEMARELKDEGLVPTVTGGGVAFVVQFGDGQAKKQPPRRLATLAAVNSIKLDSREYSVEDKQLMADILRQEKVANKSLQARQTVGKAEEVKSRRLCKSAESIQSPEPNGIIVGTQADVDERRKTLQLLARRTREARAKEQGKSR